jgi:hypothetical protein
MSPANDNGRPRRIDWGNVTVWTLALLYGLLVLALAGVGAAYLAGWLA